MRAVEQVEGGAHPEDVAVTMGFHKNTVYGWLAKVREGVTSKDDLKNKATNALRRLQKLPHLVAGFFRDPNLAYITA